MRRWTYWWTVPILIFAGITGPGMTPELIATMPIAAAVLVAAAYVVAWAVLALTSVISALWTIDQAIDLWVGRQP